ncbi:MAG: DUF4349 domain-containing protein, partial [Gemmatimonadaceae bacterium]
MKNFSIVLGAALLLACSDAVREESESAQSSELTGSAADAAANRMDMSKQVAGIGAAALQDGSAPPEAPLPDRQAATQGTASQVAPSMLIRTGAASIEVDRLDPAIIKVRQLAAQLGGYVANSSISGGRDQIRSATLELKIPAARYDQAVSGLGGIGRVESVN